MGLVFGVFLQKLGAEQFRIFLFAHSALFTAIPKGGGIMKKKTSVTIDEEVWKDIQKAAIDADKPVGDYIAMLYQREVSRKCKCGHQPS